MFQRDIMVSMNLYNIHPDPTNAPYREWAFEKVPALVWEKYQNQPAELKKREHVLARHSKTAHLYAITSLRERFPAGEAVIAKDAHYSYFYALYVIQGPFPAGEAVIAKESGYAFLYAWHVLALTSEKASAWGKQ